MTIPKAEIHVFKSTQKEMRNNARRSLIRNTACQDNLAFLLKTIVITGRTYIYVTKYTYSKS